MPSEPYQAFASVRHPEWTKHATIYQLNTRQFSQEGTFRAAEAQLNRLKELGVTIIWLMPIHPIGELNRKGTLGSPYAVKDYYGVNPEFGTLDDLKQFVRHAHALGMYVILDWVANHTAWDNPLTIEHPEWYARDWKGDFRPTPWWDWQDIIDLDYAQPAVWEYMTNALAYWVREVDIDGYRCDVAGFISTDFWNQARIVLDAIKPVFMLAEWENRDLHAQAFDMTYAWSWYDAMHMIAMGRADVFALHIYYSWNEKAFPADGLRMLFVSNHDKNAWEGTEFENFGAALEATIILSVLSEGMPLIYNGQESGNTRRLQFFERDPIIWQPDPLGDLYKQLFDLKHSNSALWNGQWGARMVHVPNSAPAQVLSFVRQNERDKVFVVLNLSPGKQTFTFPDDHMPLVAGQYTDYLTQARITLDPTTTIILGAWESLILIAV